MTTRSWPTLLIAPSAALLSGCGISNPYATDRAPTSTATTTASTAASRPGGGRALTAAQINRQDHPSRELLRRQQAASRQRPMLSALPISSDGVRIAIGGLARDERTTILTLTTRRGRAHTLRIYRRQLRRYGDNGHAYRVRVRR
jgi:hypothetical protein